MSDLAERIAALPPEKRALLARHVHNTATDSSHLEPQPRTTATFPLSFAQERQWVLHQWDPASPRYNITHATRFIGALDLAALQSSFAAIVARHEVLRTTFTTVEGLPCQIIHDQLPPIFRQVDLRPLAEDMRNDQLQSLATAEAQQPFDLENGPLFRVLAIQVYDDEHVIVATVHHIVFDGWSAGVIIAELNALLSAAQANQAAQLPPLPVQYADFAVWQRAWLTGNIVATQLDYWKQQLLGPLPILELPTDRPYPAVESARGAHYRVTLPPALGQTLIAWSRSEGYTLHTILLAVWKTLLYRYTGQTDLLIGVPVANRSRAETQHLIGYFANTLVLRTNLAQDPSFRSYVEQVRTVNLAALEHQDLPFEKLVESIQPQRDLTHTPLFQVMFVFQQDTSTSLTTEHMTSMPIAVETGTAKFALTLEATLIDDQLALMFEYKTDLFDATTIERLAQHYQTLLGAALTTPDEHVSRLPLLSPAEYQQLLPPPPVEPVSDGQLCLHDQFTRHAATHPHAIAVCYEGEQLTYAELNARANQVAHYLRSVGVGPERVVGLCVEPSFETIIGILGILKAGGAYLPIDPSYPSERIAWMLEDAEVRLVLTQERCVTRLPDTALSHIVLDAPDASIHQQPETNPTWASDLDHLAYIIYTSGSTGTPKGVLITQRNVVRLFTSTQDWFHFGPHDVWTLFHSFAFDFSVWEIWGALCYGGRLIIVPFLTTRSPEAFQALVHTEGVTVLNQTPSAFRQFMVADAEASVTHYSHLRLIIFGGEALNVAALRSWFERHGDSQPRLINMYGITETTVHVTYRPLRYEDSEAAQTSPIGEPIPDLSLLILDDHGQPVPIGVPGELHVGGAGLARGYWNRPALTRERFIPHPLAEAGRTALLYKTGDLVRRLANGDIDYVGRRDTQVKIRGFRIELGEIQAVLSRHPQVRDAVVVQAPAAAADDQRLMAYVVVEPNQVPSFSQLRSFLQQHLPSYMVPSSFIMIDAIPLTAHGKIDYRALPTRQQTKVIARSQPVDTPQSHTERVVADLWRSILGEVAVGVQDDFFDLGGHSLLATQVLSRIREQFQVNLKLRDFFLSPTVRGLATLIEQAQPLSASPEMMPIANVDPQAAMPLSAAQQRIWFLTQLDPESAFYNVPLLFEVVGELDPSVLEQTLNTIIRRHHALRTRFVTSDGQTIQQVQPAQPLQITLSDLSDYSDEIREPHLLQQIEAEVRKPFRLDQDLLVRASLVRCTETQHILIVIIHHIAFDEWSRGIFFNEMTALYPALLANHASPLEDLRLQYGDFAAWQRQWLQGPVMQEQMAFWKEVLHGQLPTLDMPLDYPRPSTQTSHGAHEVVTLSESLYTKLMPIARAHEATLFMLLMAAWATLLYRYSNQDDILIGTPIANRNRQELEDIIGFFANTLVIRTDLSGNPTFSTLLGRVREAALQAYAHQDVPFDTVVSDILPERQTNRTPLFQAMLVLQNAPQSKLELPDLQIIPFQSETHTSKFELTLVLTDHSTYLEGWLEYNTDLYKPHTITRMVEHLHNLLQAIADNPHQPLATLPMLSQAEIAQQVGGWINDSDTYDLY